MVGFAVMNMDDGPVGWGEHRLSEADEPLGRFGGEQGAPVATSATAAVLVYRHEIDGVGAGHYVGSVTRDAVRRAVLNEARPGQR